MTDIYSIHFDTLNDIHDVTNLRVWGQNQLMTPRADHWLINLSLSIFLIGLSRRRSWLIFKSAIFLCWINFEFKKNTSLN